MPILSLLIGCTLSVLLFQNCSNSGLSSSGSSNNSLSGSTNNLMACTVPAVTILHSANYSAPTTQINYLSTTSYPLAVCNDGTAAMYAFRPGFGAASQRWIIYLQGGADCYDQASCAARASATPQLISTTPYQNNSVSLNLSGLLSDNPVDNPDFYDANIVEITYCSSDLWSGMQAGTGAFNASDVSTWNFQGRQIIKAVVEDLYANRGLSNATELLWTGGSAGGLGVFYTFNDVLARLPSSIRMLASPDAGYFIKTAPYLASNAPTYVGALPANGSGPAASGMVLWNGHGDEACDVQAVTSSDHLACYSPENLVLANRYPMPLFIRESLEDTYQLGANGIVLTNGVTTQTGGNVYMNYFGQQMYQDLQGLNSLYSIFAINEVSHTVYTESEFSTNNYTFSTANGSTTSSISEALGNWYRNPCNSMQMIQSPP